MDYLQLPPSSPLQRFFCLTDIKQNTHSWEMAAHKQIGLFHPPVPPIPSANASLSQLLLLGRRTNEMMLPRSFLIPQEREGADSKAPGHIRQVKGRAQGVLKQYSPKWYLPVVSAGMIRTGNSHSCFTVASATSFPCPLEFYRSVSPRGRLCFSFLC